MWGGGETARAHFGDHHGVARGIRDVNGKLRWRLRLRGDDAPRVSSSRCSSRRRRLSPRFLRGCGRRGAGAGADRGLARAAVNADQGRRRVLPWFVRVRVVKQDAHGSGWPASQALPKIQAGPRRRLRHRFYKGHEEGIYYIARNHALLPLSAHHLLLLLLLLLRVLVRCARTAPLTHQIKLGNTPKPVSFHHTIH